MYHKKFYALLLVLATGTAHTAERETGEWITEQWDNMFVVVEHGTGEPQSTGSYSLKVYRNNRDGYVTGRVAGRDGSVAGVWFDDLDNDDNPDALVWIRNVGSGSYGQLHAYTLENAQLKQVVLPEAGFELVKGYRGRDTYSMEDGRLYRTFPRYRPNDSMADPSGGTIKLRLEFVSRSWVDASREN